MSDSKDQATVQMAEPTSPSLPKDSAVTVVRSSSAVQAENENEPETPADKVDEQKKGFFAFLKTKEFYIILILGQLLAIANTSTSTFTTLLGEEGWAIPTFQTLLNYVVLTCIFTPYTIYRYGFKGWLRFNSKLAPLTLSPDIILAFCDVEGNYFIVLAYQYTTMLSAQLINFWAIVVVVIISFLFLKVRYHITQIAGIAVCIGGMGVLIASDHITGTNGGDISSGNQLKGDLFALLGASFYGLTNTAEEYFVSKRPVYEVLGQLSFYGCIIDGVQSAIFERSNYHTSTWDGKVGGYLVGFTLCLTLFYCLAPLLFRLSSAAFFNVSMLTMNFWGVCIGIKVFHYHIHWMYPIAFVLIIVGQLIYYLGQRALAEARKPWLGANQEGGVAGLFTAKKRIEHVVPGGTAQSEHERVLSPEANTSAA
ncbi:solute carrier family 35 member [Penicillium atrosanguineum]|uniref:Peptidase S28 n=1 Tax=Penicillium atrosanguineum TaxID=1132637 RepID=UPI00238F6D7E|nr:Peptidase S28 [Penicillium atrosanguineum]KAJ5148645.1 solute carrier family 35 member [Penicillium atrosanguineum]KAJ5303961.1 Peptidase S28 [Penicillium atrosanguineum]